MKRDKHETRKLFNLNLSQKGQTMT